MRPSQSVSGSGHQSISPIPLYVSGCKGHVSLISKMPSLSLSNKARSLSPSGVSSSLFLIPSLSLSSSDGLSIQSPSVSPSRGFAIQSPSISGSLSLGMPSQSISSGVGVDMFV